MLLEIHAHTSRYSKCSQADPVALVRQVRKKELQGVILTEHHYLWKEDEMRALRIDAEVEDNFLILAGQEVETDAGHVLVFGAGVSIEKFSTLPGLRKRFPDAAFILAHPFRKGASPKKEALVNPLLDAVEIFSVNHAAKENYLGLKAWHGYKFTAVSGSDAHAENTAGMFPLQFDHPVRDMRGVVEEIKAGRVRPFFKEIPKSGGNMVVTEITIGTKGADESRSRIILKNVTDVRKWPASRRSAEFSGMLYENGFSAGQFRVPKIIDINEDEKLLIEEGQRGKNLFDLLAQVDKSVGADYFRLSARWLARLHNKRIRPEGADGAIKKEEKRFESYLNSFIRTKSPYLDEIRPIVKFVREEEKAMRANRGDLFMLNHGDYHPKNIIIGQDRMQDITTLFISVIDFANAIVMPAAFDVGYFLAQFESQFHDYPAVLKQYKERDFLETYLRDSDTSPEDFRDQVNLFKIRANLSIASYLIKVGKGESQEMKAVISRCSDELS
ncbi:MAG: phosphotransferase [Candidatus Omnitrophota bacterium]